MFSVQKRDGEIAEFSLAKITEAIKKAFDATKKQYNQDIIDLLGFNCAILENDKHSIETYLDIFTKRNLKEHERIEIYTKAFKYYLLLKDRSKIEEYYLLLKTYNLKEIEELYLKYKDSI